MSQRKKIPFGEFLKIRELVCLVAVLCAGCAQVNGPGSGGGSGGSGSSSVSSYLYTVEVSTTYENSSYTTVQGSCTIPTGTVAKSPGPGPTIKNCTINIPQIQLYFSSLSFNVSVAENTCALMKFEPYGYQISSANPYVGPSNASSDCSGATVPMPVACFGGAWIDLAPSFPTNTGTYFLPVGSNLTQSYTVQAANTKRQTGGEFIALSNRWTVNDLTTQGVSQAGYVGGTMQNWTFQCSDEKDDLYRMVITISDVDGNTSDPSYSDW